MLDTFIDVSAALVAFAAPTLASFWGYHLTVHPIGTGEKENARKHRYERGFIICGCVGILAVGITAYRGTGLGKQISELVQQTKIPPSVTVNVPPTTVNVQPTPIQLPSPAPISAPVPTADSCLTNFSNRGIRELAATVVSRMKEQWNDHLSAMMRIDRQIRVSMANKDKNEEDAERSEYRQQESLFQVTSKQVMRERDCVQAIILERLKQPLNESRTKDFESSYKYLEVTSKQLPPQEQ